MLRSNIAVPSGEPHTASNPVRIPAASLLPGTKIRVGIKHGFGNAKATTIVVTLPGDFVGGRPIRLKGLGRKLGPLTGDLYLRVLAK